MAININSNMALGSAQYLDARQSVADLDALLALDTNIIPNGFECYVEALDCKYKYHEDYNETGTGHWKLNISEGEGVTIDDETISTYKTWSSEKIFIETAENYAIFEGVIGNSYYSTIIDEEDITNVPSSLYGGWTLDTVTSNGDVESILSNYNNATTKRVISLSDILSVNDISDTSISLEDTTKNSGGQPYKFILVWENNSKELDGKIYTSLAELGLTAPVTVGDIFNAMPDKTTAIISCEDITVHITDAPTSYGILTIKKNDVGRFSIDYQSSLASSPCNVKRWIGTLKGNDGTGLYWKEVAYKDDIATYKSLSELGLDTTATLKDITRAMAKNSMIAIKVDAMANQSEYNSILQGTVTIYKIEDARIQAIMTEKSTGRTWVGILGGENTIIGWKELRSDSPFHRIVVQGVAGYFKFKPTSNGIDQSLRISVTDNYGGMINISGATPTVSQYKPFKCIRLSYGEYSNYDAMKLANNKMLKLFYYDGYFYLKVTTYTTCTFTGLVEAPTYVETLDETVAEEIPIRSVFDTPYNDGYADPSIIAIGDTDSSDGVIKTLGTLGFTGDIMTWNTGEYRISHVAGLTNLPTEVTEEKPGFRLAHYDVKKWGSNHNPYVSTYGCRQSILHYKGNIFVRYTESGANAGVLITDTGWRKINTNNSTTLVTNTSTLKLDVTKKNSSWYGAIKLTYLYDTSPVEMEICFRSATDAPTWTINSGQKYVKNVTYTQDSNNTAHYTIGIEFAGTTYGCYQAEVIGGFADINSLTGEAFTGAKTAIYYAPWGKNNGVSLVSAPEDIGLTFPCTSVQLVQAMRNKFNKAINAGAIGIFNNGGKTVCITDAPNDYGLLHIECFGHDRLLIRYDGIGGSSYAGSWIGKVTGSNGTFSGVTWERIDNHYSTGEVAVGTWIDGKTIYRKTFTKSPTSNQSNGNQVTIDVATISGLTNVIDIQATAKLQNYNNTSAPIYAKIPFSEMWRSNSGSTGAAVYSIYVEGTTLKLHANSCTSDDIYYVTVEYTK